MDWSKDKDFLGKDRGEDMDDDEAMFLQAIHDAYAKRNKDGVFVVNPEVVKKMQIVANEMYELCGGKEEEEAGMLKVDFDFESDPFKEWARVVVKCYRASFHSKVLLDFASMCQNISVNGVYPPYKDCKVEIRFNFAHAFIAPSDINK